MTGTFDDCLACDLASGRIPLPGGLIHETGTWRVEHCVGPLGLGTLIVKPARHVTAVADLSGQEASELGPLLVRASGIVRELTGADQVYNCLWSHAGGIPVHLHLRKRRPQPAACSPPNDTPDQNSIFCSLTCDREALCCGQSLG